ncbi:hypothetical protein VitviT2T_024034 [Vitis vinifera]|uniref:Uncharacterized protein n=1 Tax=Vitis vinifera TaxID=29760 RepID=A0ABY9DFD9_VITVI|nr:hypothetical protein VitviT2T_024034 [Vitis vinifera]
MAPIRNGLNPHHQPHGPHHLFESDGMLHSIPLSDTGQATFCCFYTIGRVINGQIDPMKGFG